MSRTNALGPAVGVAALALLAWAVVARGLNPEGQGIVLSILDGANLADAQSMDLPLIGGDHDWNYLLERLGLLNQGVSLGRVIFICGVVLILLAIIGLGREFIQRWKGSNV